MIKIDKFSFAQFTMGIWG